MWSRYIFLSCLVRSAVIDASEIVILITFVYRIRPTCDWIQSQVPEVVKNGISHLQDDMDDAYEVDVEALVHAYVNIVAGACISLGI